MRSSFLIGLLFNAALISAAAVVPRILAPDDVILYGEDRVEIMKRSEYESRRKRTIEHLEKMTPRDFEISVRNQSHHHYHPSRMPASTPRNRDIDTRSKVLSRRCSSENIFTIGSVVNFTGDDVVMSSVLHGTGLTNIVAVTQGYTITNTVTVGVTVNINIIKDFLGTTYHVDYSKAWASSYMAAYSFFIPPGLYGAAVSNPITTRRTGFVDVGCIAQGKREPWTSDSFYSQNYGGLDWVAGLISLCTGTSYPMKKCTGNGTLT